MSLAGHGAYRNLLDKSWELGGRLPNDQSIMWRYAMARSPEEFESVRAEVMQMFIASEDGKWLINDTLMEEWLNADEWYKKKSAAGTRGANSRWGNNQPPDIDGYVMADVCDSDGTAITNQCQSDGTEKQTQWQNMAPYITLQDNTVSISSKESMRDKKSTREEREAAKTDERYGPFVDQLSRYWKAKNPELAFKMTPACGAQLKKFLKDNPKLTEDQFYRCLVNRYKSDMNHTQKVNRWIGRIGEFFDGPLDKFWKPINGENGNGKQSPGDRRLINNFKNIIGSPVVDTGTDTAQRLAAAPTERFAGFATPRPQAKADLDAGGHQAPIRDATTGSPANGGEPEIILPGNGRKGV